MDARLSGAAGKRRGRTRRMHACTRPVVELSMNGTGGLVGLLLGWLIRLPVVFNHSSREWRMRTFVFLAAAVH
jgi:hypothetical protein